MAIKKGAAYLTKRGIPRGLILLLRTSSSACLHVQFEMHGWSGVHPAPHLHRFFIFSKDASFFIQAQRKNDANSEYQTRRLENILTP